MNRFMKSIIALFAAVAALILAIVYAYQKLFRPWHVRWGASDEEVERVMPGDELVANANLQTTRALTIAAPPERVWPWLVQLGQGRGGFYSYDLLENAMGLDIRSANQILLEHQHLAVGDIIPLEPEGDEYRVSVVEPERLLLLYIDGEGEGTMAEHFRKTDPASTWAFVLEPLPDERTRLIARWHARYPTSDSGDSMAAMIEPTLEPAEFIMERKMLLGIREVAESQSPVGVSDG